MGGTLAFPRRLRERRRTGKGQGSALKPAKGLCPLDPQQRRSLCNPSVGAVGREAHMYRGSRSDPRSERLPRSMPPPVQPLQVKGPRAVPLPGIR